MGARSAIQPIRRSKPRYINTPFGVAEINGPFVDDYTTLKWTYQFEASGLVSRGLTIAMILIWLPV